MGGTEEKMTVGKHLLCFASLHWYTKLPLTLNNRNMLLTQPEGRDSTIKVPQMHFYTEESGHHLVVCSTNFFVSVQEKSNGVPYQSFTRARYHSESWRPHGLPQPSLFPKCVIYKYQYVKDEGINIELYNDIVNALQKTIPYQSVSAYFQKQTVSLFLDSLLKNLIKSQARWCMCIVPTLRRQRNRDC